MRAWITQITQLTPDVKSFHLSIPGRPGFRPGQFLVLAMNARDKDRKRAYSIASPPHWENVEVLIKLHPGGKLTPLLFQKNVGDELSVEMPFGTFYLDDHRLPRKVVFLGGGVGVSVLLAMIRHLEWIKYPGEATLICGNRTPADIVHKAEVERLSREWRLKVVDTIDHPEGTGWSGETGYITPEMIARYCDVSGSDFYMCGPPQMVAHMVENLERLGVAHERVHKEQW